jgi:hypothetical protein
MRFMTTKWVETLSAAPPLQYLLTTVGDPEAYLIVPGSYHGPAEAWGSRNCATGAG